MRSTWRGGVSLLRRTSWTGYAGMRPTRLVLTAVGPVSVGGEGRGREKRGGDGREGRGGEGCGTIVSIPCPAPCRSCMGIGEPCHHAVHQLLRGAPLHGHSHLKGAFCGAGQEHLDRQPGQRESIAAFMAIRSTMCEVVVVSSVHLGCTVEQLHTVSTSLV